ncbi:MAG: Uma2 family endonuclease [Polyangiaceae bacterium]|nr:Uma2 family endonuclease [Polyangiaceae bacterium]
MRSRQIESGQATYEDLFALGEDARVELLDGNIVALPPLLPEHGLAQSALGSFVGRPFHHDDGRGGPGGWWILPEVDIQLTPHDVVRPDMAGWKRERLPSPWGQRPIRVVPDWICEVLSPSNERHDRFVKMRLYAHAGVAFYWIINPAERLLEAFELHEGRWLQLGTWDDEAVARIPPFELIELEVGRLFPPR